jgi:hypothetical protein
VNGLWARLGKIKCAAIWVGLCVGFLSTVLLSVYVSALGRHTLAHNYLFNLSVLSVVTYLIDPHTKSEVICPSYADSERN